MSEATSEGGVSARFSRIGLAAAAAAFAAAEIGLAGTSMPATARHAAAVTVATAVCWTLEAMPLGATSLLPLALFPVLGVIPARTAAETYFDDVNFLFLGGMLLGAGIERWGLHRRLALSVVRVIGTSPRRVVLGFLAGTAFLSIWISNTATAVMMAPIALAVLETGGVDRRERPSRAFGAALMLAVAYGANIGGIGSPIGTGPNMALLGQFAPKSALAGFAPPSFLAWMAGMVPLLAVVLLVTWLVLTRVAIRVPGELPSLAAAFRERTRPGPWSSPERRIGLLFLAAVVLWITRSIPVEGREWGWIRIFPEDLFPGVERSRAVTDSTVAVVAALVAFALPAGSGDGRRLIDAASLRSIPWDMLLLLGGGFAIAKAFTASGLSEWLGASLGPAMRGLGAVAIVGGISLVVTFLSEVTSNTATALVMLPVSAEIGRACGIDPRLPAIAVCLASSLAYMLPIGTPPNAIVFASRRIEMREMLVAGLLLNLLSVALATLFVFLWIAPTWGVGDAGP